MALALDPRSSRHPRGGTGSTDTSAIQRAPAPRVPARLVACTAAVLAVLLVQEGAVLTNGTDLAVRVLLPATMVGLLPLAWLGRKFVGAWVMAAGLLLNLTVIVANGGLMPIAPETVESVAGADELAKYETGQRLPGSKDILLLREDTRLQPLSDHVVVPLGGWSPKAVSPGDLTVALGIALIVAQALGQRAGGWMRQARGLGQGPLEKRVRP